jgi:hypothetical protein
MIKRQWPSVLFIIAFVISLAHASIPHTHPEISKQKVKDQHTHGSKSSHDHDHEHQSTDHHHDASDSKLPVFTHFSNADYVGNALFKLTLKGKYLIEAIEPEEIRFQIPITFTKPILFPKARDLPSGRHRSVKSLRAPPYLF